MMTGQDTKNREERLRYRARQCGLYVRKSRRQDPSASDYGMYYIADPEVNGLLARCSSLDDVEREIEAIAGRSAN